MSLSIFQSILLRIHIVYFFDDFYNCWITATSYENVESVKIVIKWQLIVKKKEEDKISFDLGMLNGSFGNFRSPNLWFIGFEVVHDFK